jgi:hypothetical protein
VRVYVTTAVICSGVRLSAKDGIEPRPFATTLLDRRVRSTAARQTGVGSGVGNRGRPLGLVREQQDDERRGRDGRDHLHGADDAVESTHRQKLGKPELSKNHSALVSQSPTSSRT